MTRDRLQSLSYTSLKEIARKEGIAGYQNLPMGKLIEAVVEAIEEDRNERITTNNMIIRGEEKKYDIFRDEEIEAQDITEYHIPETYNETKINLMLVEPLLAYAYWDFSEKDRLVYANISNKQGKLFLRVFEGAAKKVKPSEENFFDIPVSIKDKDWYINLPKKNETYFIQLILFMYGEEKVLCSSAKIQSPAKTIEDVTVDGDFISEEMLLLAGFYDFEDNLSDENNDIPQRIISFMDNKYLNDSDDDSETGV